LIAPLTLTARHGRGAGPEGFGGHHRRLTSGMGIIVGGIIWASQRRPPVSTFPTGYKDVPGLVLLLSWCWQARRSVRQNGYQESLATRTPKRLQRLPRGRHLRPGTTGAALSPLAPSACHHIVRRDLAY
jgi:hypothetical protein